MSDAKQELKPCPFCGRVPSAIMLSWGTRDSVIECNCPAMPLVRDPDRETAIARWNHRPTEDALSAVARSAREDSERLRAAVDCRMSGVTIYRPGTIASRPQYSAWLGHVSGYGETPEHAIEELLKVWDGADEDSSASAAVQSEEGANG